jgi:hypothetical protein
VGRKIENILTFPFKSLGNLFQEVVLRGKKTLPSCPKHWQSLGKLGPANYQWEKNLPTNEGDKQ